MSNRTGLSDLLKAFQRAILGAQTLMQDQHVKQLTEYIDSDGKAKTVTVQVPDISGKDKWRTIEVPKLTLSPPSSLKIKRMKISFQAKINGLSSHSKEDDLEHEVQIHMGGVFSRSTEADIEIEFEGTEPPEGFARINDELIKAIH